MLNSSRKVLHLLAACQKYEMDSIQSLIRIKVKSQEFPAPKGTEAFAAYAIASGKVLIPEMENAARQTLCLPMTFEVLGEGLRLFEGWALRDLAKFRRLCFDNVVECLDTVTSLPADPLGPSTRSIWVGCPDVMSSVSSSETRQQSRALPTWLNRFLSRSRGDLELHKFTQPPGILINLYSGYFRALRTHVDCDFCTRVQAIDVLNYIKRLDKRLEQVLDKVIHFFDVSTSSTPSFTSWRCAVIVALSLV
jgi:hypothetical protein